MFQRNRYRRTFSALPTAADRPRPLRMFLVAVLAVLVVLWGGWKLLQAVGILNQLSQRKVVLSDITGAVNMSIEGSELRRAEDAKLYPEDRIVSNSGGRAHLAFFDGTLVGIDESSDMTITKSGEGTKQSYIELELTRGRLFANIPTTQAFSGSVMRTVKTPVFTALLPASTRAIVSERGMEVLEADGLGVIVQIENIDEPAYIGEGQRLALPEGTITGSIYSYRSTIDPAAVRLAALLGDKPVTPTASASGSVLPSGGLSDLLVVRAPKDDQLVTTATVKVEGQVGPTVQRVRINGHDAKVDAGDGSFTQELAVTAGATMDVLVEALDARDVVVAQENRTVTLKPKELGAPTITSPAKEGSVYRTNVAKFEIRGTAPAGAAGVYVNDYKLQLFKSGDITWTYLANAVLGNLHPGRNDFVVYVVDSTGAKGPSVTLTILFEEGQQGVVSGSAASAAATTSSAPEISETTLPQNAPLTPGILSITAPSDGSPYTATTNDILIEGKTAAATDSIWINGYKLKLYTAGKTFWNYYAREQYGTLKKGKNTYKVNARNAKGEILDSLTYEINY